MGRKSFKENPLLVTCPYCVAAPGFSCTEEGYVLTTCHKERYVQARLSIPNRSGVPRTKPLSLVCPHCKAMPLRTCTGPPPFRDPKPIHKARWLAAERVDNTIRKARGQAKKESLSIAPIEDRPWLKENTEAPSNDVVSAETMAKIEEMKKRA